VLARIEPLDPREQLTRQSDVPNQTRGNCRAIDVSAPCQITRKEAVDIRKRVKLDAQRNNFCSHELGRFFDQWTELLNTLEFNVIA